MRACSSQRRMIDAATMIFADRHPSASFRVHPSLFCLIQAGQRTSDAATPLHYTASKPVEIILPRPESVTPKIVHADAGRFGRSSQRRL